MSKIQSEDDELSIYALASSILNIVPSILRDLYTDVLNTTASMDSPESHDLSEFRVTTNQLAFLRVLVEHERCTMQELAEYLRVTAPTMTAMVKRLLALGYVTRDHDTADWRMVWITPTEHGRQLVHLYDRARLHSLQTRLTQLTSEDRECITAALPVLQRLLSTK
ncbi:MarR family transcriptional regulator [Dictyobacter arantiisoli]|uniref:HTH marR-type domain-containing protein n=1 Tax=Dictyobacter arantiisoli TaxID=2014874 RepID=A0A5A5TKD5_9CHLR|nr:MarR family transcriptional regulator [Dictyobacter arantiisoli]GCF11493.1 hypothetical protein KDI_50570 [Dictyobacter arantiisoli]